METATILTGTVRTRAGHTYIFRNDHAFDSREFWAWDIHDPAPAGRIVTHKWTKLPKGFVTLFDLDNPPETVGYIPILNKNGG